ncbi:MAG TPA: PEGA domain-containing protein [Methanospirillum sp.]|nr:PEGA domain-containing protein [Methanospirillum sp.]
MRIILFLLLLSIFLLSEPVIAATVLVNSSPAGADILFDGVSQGKTPITLPSVQAGIHEIHLTKPGYDPYTASVTVRKLAPYEVYISLVQATSPQPLISPTPAPTATLESGSSSISLTGTAAAGAVVIVNPPQVTPVPTPTPPLPSVPKPDRTRPGPVPSTRPTSLPQTIPTPPGDLSGSLSNDGPNSGMMEIMSHPEGASVYLDGALQGTAPLTLNEISSGTHTLSLQQEGFDGFDTSFSVSPETLAPSVSSLQVSMQPKGGKGKR